MSTSSLFKPLALNTGTTLLNRIAMSAMTRTRSTIGSGVPTPLMAEYYAQRSSKGSLVVTECTQVSLTGRGYGRSPGIHNEDQKKGWRQVVDAVHAKGGVIYLQIYHAGRVTHTSLTGGKLPVAPSPVPPAGKIFGPEGEQHPYETPAALTEEEIGQIVKDFAAASRMAVETGFDGVEIHAANGYLVQEFLASATNKRTDKYGGSVEKRARFLLEVVDACQESSNGRVAVKISPGLTFTDLQESEQEAKETYDFVVSKLAERRINYLHLSDFAKFLKAVGVPDAPVFSFDVFRFAHEKIINSDTRLIANGGFSIQEASEIVASGAVDAVSFGSLFLNNPDLVRAVELGVPLRPFITDRNLWYGRFTDASQDHIGYTEYPPLCP